MKYLNERIIAEKRDLVQTQKEFLAIRDNISTLNAKIQNLKGQYNGADTRTKLQLQQQVFALQGTVQTAKRKLSERERMVKRINQNIQNIDDAIETIPSIRTKCEQLQSIIDEFNNRKIHYEYCLTHPNDVGKSLVVMQSPKGLNL